LDAVARGETRDSRTGGTVVFEHVTLGRALAVEVTREGSGAVLEARGPGPSRPGERVRLRVRAGEGSAILRGRVVHKGVAAGDLAVRARLEASGGEQGFAPPWLLRTGPDGRFAIEAEPIAAGPATLHLVVGALAPLGAELAIARRPIPSELAAGTYELGDFTLLDTPVVAAGIVVDGHGRPIAHATVTPSIPLPRSEDDKALPPCWLVPARSDAAGRFEIRGDTAAGSISLLATKQDLVGDAVLVPACTRDARLVLGAAAAIEGVVLLEPSLLGAMVLVEANREAGSSADTAPGGSSGVVGRDGAFSLSGLQPGSHTLRIVYAANATELAKVDSVAARAGETTRDPRLDPLDLRATCQLITLEICDENGRPVANGRAYSRPSAEPDAKWAFGAEEAGRLQLLSNGRALDVAISAPGFLRTECDRVATSQRVTLRRAVKLRLELSARPPVLEPPLRLGASLTPLRPGRFASLADANTAWFDERGVLRCTSQFVGDMRLEFFVAGSDSREYLQEGAPRVIAVADHASEQVHQIALDPEKLAAAVRSCRENR
ncbi:MAG TPA: hypothetical protein VFT55_12435, partial [Planctomycetota bacterium]|nr:hypothetical protein [Planctomycetota bacterium]